MIRLPCWVALGSMALSALASSLALAQQSFIGLTTGVFRYHGDTLRVLSACAPGRIDTTVFSRWR